LQLGASSLERKLSATSYELKAVNPFPLVSVVADERGMKEKE